MSLITALFAPAQAKLLGRLFGESQRWYHVNELIRTTGLGSATVQRELKRLAEAGLLVIEKVGNVRRIRANDASPIYPELSALVTKTLGVVPVLKQALDSLAPQISLALVYGSVANRTDKSASDIDLMVVSSALGAAELLPALLAAESNLGRTISPTIYSVPEFKARRSDPDSFVNKVLSQPTMAVLGEVADPFLEMSAGR